MHPGFIPKNHPNATKKRGVDDSVDDRETPPCVYVPLDAEFKYTLDAAASHHNAKCDLYCTLLGTFRRAQGHEPALIDTCNGLSQSWRGHHVWVNPPFSGLRPWVEKAWDEDAPVVTVLLPNNRGEQPFWQKLIEPFRDRAGSILTTRLLPKRRPFLYHGQDIGNRTSKNPPFGLVLVVWDRRRPRMAEAA